MSSDAPTKGHRQTRSAAIPGIAASSQTSRNPHHQNQHSHTGDIHSRSQNYSSDSVLRPATPPRTPRKDNQPLPHPESNSAASGSGSKQKPRNKNRPKNVLTSPIGARKDRNASPFPGIPLAGMASASKPINTPSTAAYAGPTFHASPAPSALPIPSFYSKSVPDSPGVKGLKQLLRNDHLSTPLHPTPVKEFQREESPLDFFFKADREEKARAHSASQVTGAAGPFQPPEKYNSSQVPPAESNKTHPRQRSANRLSSGGIFAMEMDGGKEVGTPYGPAFSTPYSERINAARNKQQNISSEQQAPGSRAALTKSEALKAYLFSGTSSSPPIQQDPTAPGALAANGDQPPPATYHESGKGQVPHHRLPNGNNGHDFAPDPKQPSSNNMRLPARSSGLRQEVASTRSHAVQYHNDSDTNVSDASQKFSNVQFSHMSQANESHTSPYFGSSPGNRSADLLGMEDSLRKILKLPR